MYEGEKVRAHVAEAEGERASSVIWMEKEDGSEVLRGTVSIGPDHPTTELDQRLAQLATPSDLVVLEGVRVGARGERLGVRMRAGQHMGRLYPFSLNQKLERITEPSPWYRTGAAAASPFSRAIIPMEMVSVLVNHVSGETPFYTKGPVVGLFADQEIRLVDGPLLVDEPYEIDREVVAISGSRRTESLWILTRVYRPGSNAVIASMLLNSALLKDSVRRIRGRASQPVRRCVG